jgi:hypothetical protein
MPPRRTYAPRRKTGTTLHPAAFTGPIRTMSDLVAALGGRGTVARFCRVREDTVGRWQFKGHCHPAYWRPLCDLARQKGRTEIDIARLYDMQIETDECRLRIPFGEGASDTRGHGDV